MAKNSAPEVKRGRGRPAFKCVLPCDGKMTVNDIWEKNPHFDCRLSVYNHVNKLVKKGILARTREKIPTGSVGKPMDVFITVSALNRSKAAKKAAKSRKLAKLAPVTLTPAPVAPVEVPQAPVA